MKFVNAVLNVDEKKVTQLKLDKNTVDKTIIEIIKTQQTSVNEVKSLLENQAKVENPTDLAEKIKASFQAQKRLAPINKVVHDIHNRNKPKNKQVDVDFYGFLSKVIKDHVKSNEAILKDRVGDPSLKLASDRLEYYKKMYASFNSIKSLASIEEDIGIDQKIVQQLQTTFIAKVKALSDESLNKFEDLDLEDGCFEIDNALNHLKSIQEVFTDEEFKEVREVEKKLQQSIMDEIKNIKEEYEKGKSAKSLAICLVDIKELSDNLNSMKDQIDK